MPVPGPGRSPARAAGGPQVRRRLSAKRRRALILEGAATVFAERGYSGASMTDIAAASGVAASVIYDHFASKQELHLELLNQHARAMVEATTMMPAGEGGEELVRRRTDAFFSFVERSPFAWRMLFRDPPADEQIAAAHARIHQQGTAAIAALIHLVPALRLPVDIPRERADEMLARVIKSGNDGLATWWYEHPGVPREQIVEVAVSLYWQGLAQLTGPLPAANDR